MRISAAPESGTRKTLMKVVKNPFTQHLPPGTTIYGAHMKGELVDPIDLAPTLPDGPICFVFGAMSHGFISGEHCEKLYSFSQYPVSRRKQFNAVFLPVNCCILYMLFAVIGGYSSKSFVERTGTNLGNIVITYVCPACIHW